LNRIHHILGKDLFVRSVVAQRTLPVIVGRGRTSLPIPCILALVKILFTNQQESVYMASCLK